jgi:hypothetical protein
VKALVVAAWWWVVVSGIQIVQTVEVAMDVVNGRKVSSRSRTTKIHHVWLPVKERTPALGYVGIHMVIEWIWLQTWARVIVDVEV